jgi:superfamily I DNA/RNA helicase
MNLNPEQLAAVESTSERVAVIAGPGSGKTQVIVERVRRMLNKGRKVAIVTLTNSAADEITERLGDSEPWHCGTIHGLALRIVRMGNANVTVLSESDAEQLETEACSRVGYKGTRKAFEHAKACLLETGYITGERDAVAAVRSWLGMQIDGGVLTFDGLLHFAAEMLASCEIPNLNLVVDEGQDCATADFRIFRLLRPVSTFLVGDPDQAIFGFRGGNHLAFLRATEGGTVLKLEQNYRCPGDVCAAANSLIKWNDQRIRKIVVPNKGLGLVTTVHCPRFALEALSIASKIEDSRVAGESCAVICRTNMIVDMVRTAIGLHEKRIELPSDWTKCRQLLSVIVNRNNDWIASIAAQSCGLGDSRVLRTRSASCGVAVWKSAFSQLPDRGWLNWVATHVSQESILRIRDVLGDAALLEPLTPEMLVMLDDAEVDTSDSIVMTIHKAKGREFDRVWIPCCDVDHYSGDDVEELRRLIFVAVTRTKQQLTLSWSDQRPSYGGKYIETYASQMIEEMGL